MWMRRSARAVTAAASSAPSGRRSSEVQAGGHALHAAVREPGGQRGDERVPAVRVLAAGAAQVAVDLARGQQPGVGALGDHGAARVDRPALPGHGGGELGRREQPAEPQRGRQRLRRRADVDDPVGREALERADRRAVVAVLGVVVVLDHEPAPGEQRAPALRGEHRARRELVRRGDAARRRRPARRPARRPRPPAAGRARGRPSGSWPSCRPATGPRRRSGGRRRRPAPGRRATAPGCSREVTTMASGEAAAPRTRTRWAASSSRRTGSPRGSP